MIQRISRDLERRYLMLNGRRISRFFKNEDLALPNVMDGENGIGWKNIFSVIWKQGYRWLLIWHFCPDLNCVSRTWYYVFHAYRLCRDLGENTVRRKTTISTASGEKEESCTAFYPTRGFYLKKKMWFFLSRNERFKNSREGEEIDLPMIIRKFCYRKNYI